jgi:GWxTD domain-containing protein
MRGSLAAVAVAGAVLLGPARGNAQSSLIARADSLAFGGDSLAALRLLDQALAEQKADASTWHRRGVIAWRMSGAERRTPTLKRLANDSLVRIADASLRRAVDIDDDTPRYLIDLARFDLTSNSAAVRGRAHDLFERALRLARERHDSVAASEAADGLGMEHWRRYEPLANRSIYSSITRSLRDRSFLADPRSIAYFVDNIDLRAAAQEWSGQQEYLKALDYFEQATAVHPGNGVAQQHVYMALVERQRWVELLHAARTRLVLAPHDGWAWAAAGLASHRLGDDHIATMAFDSALAYFTPAERERYNSPTRIFTPRDASADARLPDEQRVRASRLYWLMADPLWLTPNNEHHLEYLSRVISAELRFGVAEFGLDGADTDRGEVFVRYGPPPAVISFPPDPARQQEHRVRELWWYSADEAFLFQLLPGYGVAALEPYDARVLARLRDTVPVVWRNAGSDDLVDSITVRMALFRGPPDSADVFVSAELPVGSLTRGIDLTTGSLQLSFEGFDWNATPVFQRTSHEIIDFARHTTDETRAWRTRVPDGIYLYRVEALEADAMRGARAASRLDIGSARGFGMSDVIVADQVTPIRGTEGARWSDFAINPNIGRVKQGEPVALLWETYALGVEKARNRYRVAITLTRAASTGFAGFVAKVVGGVKSAIGLSSRGQDRVSLVYPRETPASPVDVDYITLDLGNAPPGEYTLAIEVTDLVNHARTVRQSTITIIE